MFVLLGDPIRFGALLFIIFKITFFSVFASARSYQQCTQLFIKPATPKVIQMDLASAEALHGFELNREELLTSRTVEDFHQSLYSLATSANEVLDAMVENIFVLNTQRLSSRAEADYVRSTDILFAKIEAVFQIPATMLTEGLKQRVQERIRDEKLYRQALLIQAPLGFDIVQRRTDPAGREDIEKVPMGFVNFRSSPDHKSPAEKLPPGFVRFKKTTADAPEEKVPMGFAIKKSEKTVAPTETMRPIGFVHFGKTPLTEIAETKQIFLDLQTGYFNVQ